MKDYLINYDKTALEYIITHGYNQPVFRAGQINGWLYKGAEICEMHNLPSAFRLALADKYEAFPLSYKFDLYEEKTDTRKFIFSTADGIFIESVALNYDHGICVCVSTQAGCRMGCAFCESGKGGLIRNLTPGEMLSQIIRISKMLSRRITNIVLMGSGEPLDNYDNVKEFILRANSPDGLSISMRNITLSTCGIVSGIKRLIEDKIFVNLSLSLHAPSHELRSKIMPVEKAYNINEAIQACKQYRKESSRRITLEYCLIEGFNDTAECAKALYQICKNTDMLINLIDVNSTKGKYTRNSVHCMRNFVEKLKSYNINYTIRRRLGSSINAACGQLRSEYAANQNGGA